MTERRIRDRFLCADLVKVDWILGEDNFRTAQAVLEDIASPGACVQVEEPIPLGTALMLTLGNSHLTGQVCYCVFRDYGYFVGIRFSDDTSWSSESAPPRHLTNLQSIAEMASRPAIE